MGLFEKLGRQVEQFKQNVEKTAGENTNYQCQACGERFNTHDGQCPECGAERIAPITGE